MSKKPDQVKTLPAYTLAEAARLIGANPGTLGTWFRGRKYETASGTKKAAPVLPTSSGPREPISFIDLVEAHVFLLLKQRYRIPRKNMQAALQTLGEMKRDLTFLAHKNFFIDSEHLLLQIDNRLISLSERGQLVDQEIVASGLRQLEYGADGYASEFFPRFGDAEQREFVVSPDRNFGRLCIHRIGVSADIIAVRFSSGEKIADIAADYKATEEEIEGAIRWHGRLAA